MYIMSLKFPSYQFGLVDENNHNSKSIKFPYNPNEIFTLIDVLQKLHMSVLWNKLQNLMYQIK